MPSRKTTKAAEAAAAKLPTIPKELIDQFVTGPMSAESVESISLAFKKALIERALGAELSHHLGYRPGAEKPEDSSNHRNGASAKTVLTGDGPLRIDVPRDREGSFEPQLVKKRQVRLAGMEEKILALYARGMTTRDIETALVDLYGVEISHTLIAQVTDAVHAVFPKTLMQLCIVHLVRASLRYVTAGDSKAVVVALKRIYQLATTQEAAEELGHHHPVLPVPAGDSQGGLHHQRDRIAEHGDAQVHPQPTHLPQRRIGTEGDVPGNPGGIEELEIDPSLEAGAAELPGDVRRGTTDLQSSR